MRGPLAALLAALAVAAPAAISTKPRAAATAQFRLLALDGQHVRWIAHTPAKATRLTYAFVARPSRFEGARNCPSMTPVENALTASAIEPWAFRHEVRAAFAMWSRAAAIDFAEIADAERADILIGSQAEPRGRAFTNVRTESPGSERISQSLICLNPAVRWKIGFDGNLDIYDLRYTLAHEIGHAIGLDHMGHGGHLMSHRYTEATNDLTNGDIAGAVALYGER